MVFGDNERYHCYVVGVENGKTYYFTETSYAFVTDESLNVLQGETGQTAIDYFVVNSESAKYLFYSNPIDTEDEYISANARKTIQKNRLVSDDIVKKPLHCTITGSSARLEDVLHPTSIKNHFEMSVYADISTFAGCYFGLRSESQVIMRAEINNTVVKTYQYGYGDPMEAEYEHGLTIENNIQGFIKYDNKSNVTIAIVSNGEKFEKTITAAKRLLAWPYFDPGKSKLTDMKMSWTCSDFAKAIWCFGDSYFSYADNTWMYRLVNDGYADNCLVDGYGGENTAVSIQSLKTMLAIAKPKTIFWCLGMNDGTDIGDAPNTTWKQGIGELITLCNNEDIELVLATIPTVPSINHEQKNNFVRSSGFQYVDFAKAVGAGSDGAWYAGMLSSDNVHPTAKGGEALYRRVLLDFPQITID